MGVLVPECQLDNLAEFLSWIFHFTLHWKRACFKLVWWT